MDWRGLERTQFQHIFSTLTAELFGKMQSLESWVQSKLETMWKYSQKDLYIKFLNLPFSNQIRRKRLSMPSPTVFIF